MICLNKLVCECDRMGNIVSLEIKYVLITIIDAYLTN